MISESRPFPETWLEWAVPGEIIQIRAERNLLFRPRVSTRYFWIYLQKSQEITPSVGAARAVLLSAVVRCRRLFPRRGHRLKVPVLDLHGDEIEKARGKLLCQAGDQRPFVLDLDFPLLVDLLENCPEILKARPGDVLEIELAPPLLAYLL